MQLRTGIPAVGGQSGEFSVWQHLVYSWDFSDLWKFAFELRSAVLALYRRYERRCTRPSGMYWKQSWMKIRQTTARRFCFFRKSKRQEVQQQLLFFICVLFLCLNSFSSLCSSRCLTLLPSLCSLKWHPVCFWTAIGLDISALQQILSLKTCVVQDLPCIFVYCWIIVMIFT